MRQKPSQKQNKVKLKRRRVAFFFLFGVSVEQGETSIFWSCLFWIENLAGDRFVIVEVIIAVLGLKQDKNRCNINCHFWHTDFCEATNKNLESHWILQNKWTKKFLQIGCSYSKWKHWIWKNLQMHDAKNKLIWFESEVLSI